jgi:hypothetical protein
MTTSKLGSNPKEPVEWATMIFGFSPKKMQIGLFCIGVVLTST